ncbi:hypothetical protein C1N32_05505 [Vibrio diazotrophicus]|uniref:Catechol 2,3-dioxygenase-like lactoylglutathione lyase family enzyme n=1 Tax=Vibrio diazotrophicus TaxID=685 RepID=A0A2J8I4V3_VIBDI|nr:MULTISPECIES: hypothetical protein [Vibrio]MCF7361899.1 hypothetical protein [Vibrio sp. A1-b2]PNI05557.1 hypothetical protein C1N32_05505 [Vibrio diazotrophicus]
MNDSIGVFVVHFEESKHFYTQLLSAIGYSFIIELPSNLTGQPHAAGFGKGPELSFWVTHSERLTRNKTVSFSVENSELVNLFFRKSLVLGANICCSPSIGQDKHYKTSVFDPEGNKLEVFCRY